MASIFAAMACGGLAMAADDTVVVSTAPSWMKICKEPAGVRTSCYTGAEIRSRVDASLVASVWLIEPEGEARKSLRVTFPLGAQLAYGTRLIIGATDPKQGPYLFCSADGCVSDYEGGPELVADMKAGQTMFVQAIGKTGAPLTATLSLADFAAAYDGPPSDDRAFEQRRSRELIWQDDTLKPSLRPRAN